MWLVFLLYGAAFVLTGGLLAIQARSPARVLPGRSLWWLAGFGFVHGAAEWCSLSLVVAWSVHGRLLCEALIAVSFAVLLQFVVELRSSLGRWPSWTRSIPVVVLLLQGIVAQVLRLSFADPLFDVLVRYTAGLPAAGLACFALLDVRRTMGRAEQARQRRYLLIAAAAFAAYAVFAGLLGPEAPLPVSAVVNSRAFRELTGVPVELFRAGCAALIGLSLTEAFVVESARLHAEAGRLREEFISVVAHDLRSPLATIALLAGRLERMASARPAEAKAVMDSLHERIRGLDRIVQDLLDASRIEAKKLVLERQRLDLAKLVAGVVDRAEPVTGEHAVDLEIGEGAADVDADPVRMEQVLVNLLSNAAKYSHPHTNISVKVRPLGSEVRVSVTNSGEGVPADAVPHLFERFHRAAAHGAVPGVGLGLYVARGLVEAHGGRIWLEPQQGDRTTFCFALPCAPRPVVARTDPVESAPLR
jgi:signal transduction histidine kinase